LQALQRVESLLQSGHMRVVDADLKSYFDTIPRQPLLQLVGQRIADGKMMELLERYLKAGVMASAKEWQPSEQGTPQGAVLSPLLANLYLNPLDHEMARKGCQMVRHADDFVVCARTEEEAQKALAEIAQWVKTAGLTLHPAKTRIVNAAEKGGFDFLGYHASVSPHFLNFEWFLVDASAFSGRLRSCRARCVVNMPERFTM
jgi:RNA-directed DNA polymerase